MRMCTQFYTAHKFNFTPVLGVASACSLLIIAYFFLSFHPPAFIQMESFFLQQFIESRAHDLRCLAKIN